MLDQVMCKVYLNNACICQQILIWHYFDFPQIHRTPVRTISPLIFSFLLTKIQAFVANSIYGQKTKEISNLSSMNEGNICLSTRCCLVPFNMTWTMPLARLASCWKKNKNFTQIYARYYFKSHLFNLRPVWVTKYQFDRVKIWKALSFSLIFTRGGRGRGESRHWMMQTNSVKLRVSF